MPFNRRNFLEAAALTGLGSAMQPWSALAAGTPVLIGVPLPLTGLLASVGQVMLKGIQAATDDANEQGGLLGRPIKLSAVDTTGEPNTAATVGAQMASNRDYFALVGGYGSTADFALLQGMRRYGPIFIEVGSSSVHIEQAFGKMPWYFHVYIWDYDRAKAAAHFLSQVTPKIQTVAVAHEDGLYGTDAAKYAERYLKPAGVKVVMNEPFKAGSADFSPILERVKALNPDVFYCIAYVPDEIQLKRQAAQLGIKSKMTLFVGATEKRSDFGAAGNDLCIIREWAATQTTPGNDVWVKRAKAALGPTMPGALAFFQGYTGMKTLIDATRAAGKLERDAVLAKLSTMEFDTPYGHIGYTKSEGGALHQLCSYATMLVTQYQGQDEDVVWPADKANSKLVYPAA